MRRFIGVFLTSATDKNVVRDVTNRTRTEGLLSKLLICTDLPILLQVLLKLG